MEVLNDMYARHGACSGVKFLCVYIREAHAVDVWPIDGPEVREPRTTEERVQTAGCFQKACGISWPVVVDGVEDAFLRAFSPWPFRFFVFQGSVLRLKTAPSDFTHRADEVEAAIRDFKRAR